ncbi:CHAT domain-containing protein [Candidatus Marithioploca araucensis]|uniref:CHAT domain-containing protein n=1 Tax=Candidatus Marithioploca araucensis TaxID=70273 RepID=A0ABT7VS97_9GAMM|nr:CHAT domain-containing protein [Candidatus Marithioploca araucensis]
MTFLIGIKNYPSVETMKISLTPFIIKPSIEKLATYPHLLELALQLSKNYQTHRVTFDELKRIGLALWQFLNIEMTLPSHALVIEQCHTLFDLPWECLYHPKLGFLAQHVDYTLSRRVRVNKKAALPPKGPFNILLWTALPEKMTRQDVRLDIEIEQQAVNKTLSPFIAAGWVRFYAPSDGRFTRFVELVQSQPWHLVILNGHGFSKNGEHAFVFEGEEGEGELVSASRLAEVFKGTTVQCVVVAACQSGELLTHLVMPIVQIGVPHVIGMREPLIDRAGTVFVQTLCVALAEQKRVDVAVQEARCAMTELLAPHEMWRDVALGSIRGLSFSSKKLKPRIKFFKEKTLASNSDPSVGQWCLPMLFSHDPAQALLDWHFLPHPVESQIALSNVFIGHRRTLRTLGEGLRTGTIRRLLIHGAGGIGKTALARQLAITLAQQEYRIFIYQVGGKAAFIPTLAQALNLHQLTDLKEIFTKKQPGRWLFWLDNLERFQNPQNGVLSDKTLQGSLDILCKMPDLRMVITSRMPYTALHFHNYHLKRPHFNDFSRYLHYLGLPYQFPQRLKIYQTLGGHFQGVQLLQSMPLCLEMPGLCKQLAIVRRYLMVNG